MESKAGFGTVRLGELWQGEVRYGRVLNMDLMKKMDGKFEEVIKELDYDSRIKVRNFKNTMFGSYNFVKPLLIGLAMFWLMFRIEARVGLEQATFIVLILIAIFLRSLNSKL